MYKFHITYYEYKEDCICKGINLKGDDEISALNMFKEKYPDCIIISLINVTILNNESF